MLGKMDAIKLSRVADALLLRIHVITGWQVPEGNLLNILTDQFKKKIIESYPNVNADEVEYAFRKNTGVIDYGKNMNLALIDQVMIPYLEQRSDISSQEERLVSIPEDKMLPAVPVTDEEVIEQARETYKFTKNTMLIPLRAYPALVRKGLINLTDEKRSEIRGKAIGMTMLQYKEDPSLFKDIPKEKYEQRLAKKIAVAEYLNSNQ